MRNLTIAAVLIFVIGTILALLFAGGGDGTIINTYSFLKRDGNMHYYFTVVIDRRRQTVEVTKDVYNSYGYGDVYDPRWVKHDGYQQTDLKPMGNDQQGEPR